METISPLFPLPLVIYPNSVYSLHIFEDRYKKMIADCMHQNKSFVLVPKFENSQSKIATSVIVTNKSNLHDDGSFDIVVKGIERVLILKQWLSEDGYEDGIVDDYADVQNQISEEILFEAETVFRDVIKRSKVILEDSYWLNLETAQYKSYKIAEKSGLQLAQQIDLLMITDETARLKYLTNHLKRLEHFMKAREAELSIIMFDGYIN